MESNGERLIDKKGLLELGDKYEEDIAEARRQDAPYR